MIPIKKGAEAYLFKDKWFGRDVIKKVRISKKYREKKLDVKIRASRTLNEAKLLTEARKFGVLTPYVYEIDTQNHTIIMDYLNGPRVKEFLNSNNIEIFRLIGQKVAILHKNNLIHGDLTTSNMIIINNTYLYFIDFGLGGFSTSIEDFGVDIHLMRRALYSTHSELAKECFDFFLIGYKKQFSKRFEEINLKLEEIEMRGRYINRKEDS